MWVFINDAFYSIVDPSRGSGDKLLVRARFPGDIKRNFPNAVEVQLPNRDYAYRAEVDRNQVAAVIANHVANIKYDNFKDSVREHWRHDAYADVWAVLYREQHRRSMKNKELNTVG